MTPPVVPIAAGLEQLVDEAIAAGLAGADEALVATMRPELLRTMGNSAAFTGEFLGATSFLEPNSIVLAGFVRDHTPRLVGINNETRRAVKRLILSRLGAGEPLSQIASQIRPFIGLDERQVLAVEKFRLEMLAQGASEGQAQQLAARSARTARGVRALRIARTETGIVWHRAGMAAQREAGAPGRVWVTSRDVRVRPSHRIDSQCVMTEEPFTLANGIQLLHPHDPDAPVKEIVNCRCTAAPMPVPCQGRGRRLDSRQRRRFGRSVDRQLSSAERRAARTMRATQNAQAARVADELGRRAPVGLPPIGTLAPRTVERNLRAFERRSLESPVEVGLALDANGRKLLTKTGTKREIPFTEGEMTKLKGARSFTHNHPSSFSLSLDDLRFAAFLEIGDIRAVGRRVGGWNLHRAEIGKRFASLTKAERIAAQTRLRLEWARLDAELRAEIMPRVNAGQISATEAGRLHFHELNRRLAKILGYKYSRIFIRDP